MIIDKAVKSPGQKKSTYRIFLISIGKKTLPTMSDFLVAYATLPERPAYRSPKKGSYFVVELDDVFRKMAKREQLIDMLTEVNRRIAVGEYTDENLKQPGFFSALRKKLYLYPGKQSLIFVTGSMKTGFIAHDSNFNFSMQAQSFMDTHMHTRYQSHAGLTGLLLLDTFLKLSDKPHELSGNLVDTWPTRGWLCVVVQLCGID